MGCDQKIKVCNLISGDLWAGAETMVYSLARSLHESGEVEVSAIVLNQGRLADSLLECGIDTMVIDEKKHGFVSILNKLSHILADRSIQILHTHRYKENILGGLLKRKGKIKYLIQTVHGTNEKFSGLKSIKMKMNSTLNSYFTGNYFDRIITVSNKIENQFGNKYKMERISTIHNGIGKESLKISKDKEDIRKEFGIPRDVILIGTLGRMVPIKGYDIFIRMARVLSNEKFRCFFLLVGDGPLLPVLKKSVTQLGLDGKFIMPGFRRDVSDIINALDIFVISSIDEGIPMVLLEAMALRKAAVATSVGGIPEIIENGKSGLLAETGDIEGLAAACRRIIESPELRIKLECGAQSRIQEEFTIERQRDRTISIYKNLLGAR